MNTKVKELFIIQKEFVGSGFYTLSLIIASDLRGSIDKNPRKGTHYLPDTKMEYLVGG